MPASRRRERGIPLFMRKSVLFLNSLPPAGKTEGAADTMKRRFWKQSLSLALTFALILAMPCVTSVWAGGSVEYLVGTWSEEENKVTWTTESKAESDYTEITSDNPPTTWNNGWYVAEGEVTIGTEDSPQRVTVTGDVHLILKDGCNLTVNGGIQVAQRDSLTIYAQAEDGEVTDTTGKLTATAVATSSDAGIGGNKGEAGGAITIHGGKVTANGKKGGAGIGGGNETSGGTTNIYGGTVEAAGNTGGAGIGGGCEASGGTTNIYGGKVTANGDTGGAGIGSGVRSDSNGAVTISGGMITASSNGTGGAGIRSGTITISGGTVNASNGFPNGIGISGREISISSGTVTASADGNSGVAISGTTISIFGGTVTASAEGNSGVAISGSTISISGGTVNASSKARTIGNSKNGCGDIIISGGTVEASTIGGAYRADSSYTNDITISGGTVRTTSILGDFSTGENGHAVIYAADRIYDSSQDNRSGIIFENNTGTVYGDQTLQDDMTLSENQTLTVGEKGTLTVNEGGTLIVNESNSLTNNGTLMIYGESCLGGEGTLDGSGEFRIATPFPELKNSTLTYNGTDQFDSLCLVSAEGADGQTIKGKKFTAIELDEWEIEEQEQEIKNAGTYSVNFSCAAYGFTGSCNVTVEPAALSVTGATVQDKAYDGNINADVTDVEFSGLQNDEELTMGTNYTVTAEFENAAAGEGKNVTVTVTLSGTEKSRNYTFKNESGEAVKEITYTATAAIKEASIPLTLTANPTNLSGAGEVTLTLSGFPADAAAEFTVKCSDDSIEVTGSGSTWTATLPNETAEYTFSASYSDTNYQVSGGTCTVNVRQAITGITLDSSDLTLYVNETATLTAAVSPETAANKALTWSSDNESVAAVEADENDNTKATVTARKAGTATITVTSEDDSEIIASCTVTVEKKSTSSRYRLPDAFSQPFGCESDTLGLVDVNGAYQFRFTSEFGTPPVVELDSESFRAELASQEGNDYFWKIYAIGSAGETCNVTVNGTCVARLTAVSAAPASGLVVSDTTAPFTVAAGGSYQFRLTADAMPSMAAGSPCFTVEYVGNEGKDWFFKVYAIGNVGDACGFYVNLAPTPVAVATIA